MPHVTELVDLINYKIQLFNETRIASTYPSTSEVISARQQGDMERLWLRLMG